MGPFLLFVASSLAQSAPPTPDPFHDEIALRTDYSAYVLGTFADSLGLEADLNALQVDARSASLLQPEPSSVTRTALSDGDAGNVELKGRDRCGDLAGEWWPGNVVVRLAERRPNAEPAAGIVFVENNPTVGAVAELNSGDTLEQRSVRENGRLVSQSVTFNGEERLVLRKTNGRSTVCSK